MTHIRKLIHFIKPYWKWSVISLTLLTLVVFIDLAIPRLIQRIIDQGINGNNMQVVISTTVIMLSLSLLQVMFALGNNHFSIQVGESVARDIREALFLKIQSFSFGNLDHLNTGQLMVRLSSDTNAFQRVVQVSLRIGTRAPLLMLGSLILMFVTDSRLALMVMPVLLVTFGVIVFFVTRMGPLFILVLQKLDRLNTVLQENIAGVRLVKAFVRADFENERFAEVNEDYTDQNVRVMRFMATLFPIMGLLVNIGMVIVIWAGGIQSIRGDVSVGKIVAFINYLQTTMGPLGIMVMLANVVAAGTASAERINEVLDTVPEVQDAPETLSLPEGRGQRIRFEGVNFRYNGINNGSVLRGVELVAEPGQTVAILGATGAGKSSIVNLVPRFYDVAGGRVTWNDMDVRRVKQSDLLQQIGVVPQETILFSGSVRDNIRYGKPEASDEEVIAAAEAAQAHDFIMNLPNGYDTRIEERGVNLSGGQKQRIAIARAILLRPAVLILDDSTSSVDVETETKIQNAMKDWTSDSTSFIVAQRISTVLHADKIVVVDEGQIVAQGTHNELMKSSRVYQEIYASQLGDGVKLEEQA
ncbi:MAG: multidrug ABC transporter ATP-binding protein [Anaerolineales bacterium]|nr:ABC transporter ATP-binding protein [Anaerolineae bacterium]PWB78003.1 MAG: multidrug ABC transporter ATP-binding protein [Anaerolineales bacterium]